MGMQRILIWMFVDTSFPVLYVKGFRSAFLDILAPEKIGNFNINTSTTLLLKTIVN